MIPDLRQVKLASGLSGYLIGDASNPKGARIYGFRLVAGAVNVRAQFFDGGPTGTLLRTLKALANSEAESVIGPVNAATNVYVAMDNGTGGAIASQCEASIFVDKTVGTV